jgi:hypothetical protein
MPYKDPDARSANARENARRWHAANREKVNAKRRAYYLLHKEEIYARQKAARDTEEGKAKRAAQCQKRYAKDPEKYRKAANDWKKRAGYSSWQVYKRQQETIAGGERPTICDACGRGGKIVFDHCHSGNRHARDRTTKALSHFRGWLCERCNVALGMADNNPEIPRQLADYISRYHQTTQRRVA